MNFVLQEGGLQRWQEGSVLAQRLRALREWQHPVHFGTGRYRPASSWTRTSKLPRPAASSSRRSPSRLGPGLAPVTSTNTLSSTLLTPRTDQPAALAQWSVTA